MDTFFSMILAANTGKDTNLIYMSVIMVAFIVFYYFLFIRPQSKKRKTTEMMLKSLKKGDKVITIGGIHGKVSDVKDNEVTLRVDSNAEITFDRSAVSKVIDGNQNLPSKKEGSADKKDKKEKK